MYKISPREESRGKTRGHLTHQRRKAQLPGPFFKNIVGISERRRAFAPLLAGQPYPEADQPDRLLPTLPSSLEQLGEIRLARPAVGARLVRGALEVEEFH